MKKTFFCLDKVFCETCREDVPYIITERTMTAVLNGIHCTYKIKEPRCCRCGSPLYVSKIMDENLDTLYAEYNKRQKGNLI